MAFISILFYLFIYNGIIYLKNKEVYYLYYSLYVLVNVLVFSKYQTNVFFENNELYAHLMLWLTYPLFFFSFVFFGLFILTILKFKERQPQFYRLYINYYLIPAITVFLLLFIASVIHTKVFLILRIYYAYIFIPITVLISLNGIRLIIQMKDPIKTPLVLGLASVLMATLILVIHSMLTGYDINKNQYIFYLGMLLENMFFTYAISIRQYQVYKERTQIQKKYIGQLIELQNIKDVHEKQLEEELLKKEKSLLESQKLAEAARVTVLKERFNNEISTLKLETLRSQMNPHFIFNALNSIKAYLISSNKIKSIFYLNKFSKLIRIILENSRKDTISLEEELHIIQLYLQMENMRFEEKIEIAITTDPDIPIHTITVPPLITQPIIENAIWHGLAHIEGPKKMEIHIFKEKDSYYISIKDNGIGRTLSKKTNHYKKESLGLAITQERLHYFNKKNEVHYTIRIVDLINSANEPIGTEVRIQLSSVASTTQS